MVCVGRLRAPHAEAGGEYERRVGQMTSFRVDEVSPESLADTHGLPSACVRRPPLERLGRHLVDPEPRHLANAPLVLAAGFGVRRAQSADARQLKRGRSRLAPGYTRLPAEVARFAATTSS